jgi:hypothetical protein
MLASGTQRGDGIRAQKAVAYASVSAKWTTDARFGPEIIGIDSICLERGIGHLDASTRSDHPMIG